jgi:hypothetical protein
VKRGLFALVCLVCMAGWLASTAAACHSEVSATIDCDGKVSYTAAAWNSSDASTKSRTNADVRVWASYDNGASYTQVGSGHFGTDNGYSFAGTFSAGSAASVVVKVQEVARWASGDSPGPPRYVTATKQGCSTGPTCPSAGMVKAGPIAISGGTASVAFVVAAGCRDIQLSLVSYKAPSATFVEATADQQQLHDAKTQTVSAGTYTLSVAVPSCYYQIDFVYGTPITKLGPAGTNNFYGKQNRLIAAANGGTSSCTTTPPPPPPISTPTPPSPVSPAVAVVLTKLERVGTTGSFVTGPVTGRVGDTVYYQLSVQNTGNVMVTVTVNDPGCDAGTLVATSGVGIGPTGVATFTCSHKLTAADGSSFVNTAIATGTAGNGTRATSTSSVTAQVQPTIVVAAASTSIHTKAVPKKVVAKKVVHKHKAKHTKHVKKVTKKAKPARPVVAQAHFTG